MIIETHGTYDASAGQALHAKQKAISPFSFWYSCLLGFFLRGSPLLLRKTSAALLSSPWGFAGSLRAQTQLFGGLNKGRYGAQGLYPGLDSPCFLLVRHAHAA
jgi:hypothetical protein